MSVDLPTNEEMLLVLNTDQVISTAAFTSIGALALPITAGLYQIEFTPLYNVNNVNTGSGWAFTFTGALTKESLRAQLPTTPTAVSVFSYATITQSYTSTRSPRVNNNRCSVVAEFLATSSGTLTPVGRSELNGNAVTLLAGTVLRVNKIA